MQRRYRARATRTLAGLALTLPLVLGFAPAARAQTDGATRAEQQQRLVDRATLSAQEVLNSQANGDQAQRFLARARGVVICPSIFRMSFLIGGSGGGCVLMARDGAGSWSDPAFYAMGSGSVGFQAGVQDAQLLMFIMTRRGLTAIMDSQFKIGADASITFATLGAGMEGSTTAALQADIVAVQKSSGLFAGIALQGSMLSFDSAGNQAYYGQPVGAQDIVVAMRVNNQGADPLRAVLMRYGNRASPYPAPYQPRPAGDPVALAPSGSVQSESLAPPH